MSKTLSPEHCELNEWYSITINPDEKKVNDLKSRFLSTLITYDYIGSELDHPTLLTDNYMYCKLKELRFTDFKLFVEFSKLGKQHYHGFIKIKSWKFFMTDIKVLSSIGIIEIDKFGGYTTDKDNLLKRPQMACPVGCKCNLEAKRPYTSIDWYWYCTKNYYKMERDYEEMNCFSFITNNNLNLYTVPKGRVKKKGI